MKKNPYVDPEVQAFLKQFDEDGLPKIIDSAFMMALVDSKPDPKMCLEIGAAILLDKPIVVCAVEGAKVSNHLRKCARKIIRLDKDGKISEQAKREIEDLIYELTRNRDRGRHDESESPDTSNG